MTDAAAIGVIGAGAWGTALAQVAAQAQGANSRPVMLWLRDPQAASDINRTHANAAKLPGVALSRAIQATTAPGDLAACAIILVATPAQTVRNVLQAIGPQLAPGVRLVMTAKGFERGTTDLMTEVMAAICPSAEPLVLSGPSFADDVVRGLPTAVTLAARSLDIAGTVAEAISIPTFRLYLSDDLIGVQVGGAVKNVLAIACGIVTGRHLGDSARAALIARAFAELNRIGRILGARPETLGGLSGLGDLVLTCSSAQSRNYRLGRALGEGRTLAEILGHQRGTSEGAFTASVVVDLARRHGIDLPIATAVNDILDGNVTIDDAIGQLLMRPIKSEH
jgi:glycerol-3-phosphate dehydrogenase (NAD(P)+)